MNKMLAKVAWAIMAVVFCLGASQTASAISFTLNQSSCCGTGPFGTVDVTQFNATTVNVLVTLNAGNAFVLTGNGTNHPPFAFNLAGNPAVADAAVTIVQSGNLLGGGAAIWDFVDIHTSPGTMSDGFGNYSYRFDCTNCGTGASNPALGPLEFRISLAGITPASFVANAAGTIFAADIINGYPTGATGLVRTTGTTTVPEPTSLLLLGSGLLSLGLAGGRLLKK